MNSMREIKFRVWFPNEKSMDYSPETFTGWLNDNFDPDGYEEGEEPVFMQYTGLKDKNGKEIYEGDIIKTTNSVTRAEYLSEVEFRGGHFALKTGAQWWKDWEVVGNAYENPELIK